MRIQPRRDDSGSIITTRTSRFPPVDLSLAWLITGFILIIAELMTGTFYLLVLGTAALVGAGVAYASGGAVWQAVGAASVRGAGAFGGHRYQQPLSPQRTPGPGFAPPGAVGSW